MYISSACLRKRAFFSLTSSNSCKTSSSVCAGDVCVLSTTGLSLGVGESVSSAKWLSLGVGQGVPSSRVFSLFFWAAAAAASDLVRISSSSLTPCLSNSCCLISMSANSLFTLSSDIGLIFLFWGIGTGGACPFFRRHCPYVLL
uniref:Uncharacterized protein n=1 Tax=Cacopsylla melanoneura TaxID=428564 RepID=A0A8D9FGR8_9HEMI